MDAKTAIALFSVALAFVGYYFYISDVLARKTRPHAFSWLVWGTVTTIAFVGQLGDGAGVGAWPTAASGAITLFVFGLAVAGYGEPTITKSDKVNLGAALLAIVPWVVTSDATISMILLIIIDSLGFVPTFRKSYSKPYEETLVQYVLAAIKFGLGIFALEAYTLITWPYPASLVLTNVAFTSMVVVRRRQLPPAVTRPS